MEEDFFYPLRYEPLFARDSIGYHYRRNEETAAANQVEKAISWLWLAAGHAMPVTQKKLNSAANELATLAQDLRDGNITSAASLDRPLANAPAALAEWHYFKANESWARSEEIDAGHDLEMAAQYLQHAANSAHFEFGADTQRIFIEVFQDGRDDFRAYDSRP